MNHQFTSIISMNRRELISNILRLGKVFTISLSLGSFCFSSLSFSQEAEPKKEVSREVIDNVADELTRKLEQLDREAGRETTTEEAQKRKEAIADAVQETLEEKGYEVPPPPLNLRIIQ